MEDGRRFFNTEERKELGTRLKAARKARGETQDEFGRFLGFTQRHYQRIEKGRSAPEPKKMQEIASKVGIDISDLMQPAESYRVVLEEIRDRLSRIEAKLNA